VTTLWLLTVVTDDDDDNGVDTGVVNLVSLVSSFT
jgi:hypothetical protein